MTGHAEFEIAPAALFNISDEEIAQLLNQVYVVGGYADPDKAAVMFEPARVRARGEIIGARTKPDGRLAGMAIVVPPGAPAIQLAEGDAAEMHLLGVLPAYRSYGLGKRLVGAVIARAIQCGCGKLILWTQETMAPARKLYESLDFVRAGEMQRDVRNFSVYQLTLHR